MLTTFSPPRLMEFKAVLLERNQEGTEPSIRIGFKKRMKFTEVPLLLHISSEAL